MHTFYYQPELPFFQQLRGYQCMVPLDSSYSLSLPSPSSLSAIPTPPSACGSSSSLLSLAETPPPVPSCLGLLCSFSSGRHCLVTVTATVTRAAAERKLEGCMPSCCKGRLCAEDPKPVSTLSTCLSIPGGFWLDALQHSAGQHMVKCRGGSHGRTEFSPSNSDAFAAITY